MASGQDMHAPAPEARQLFPDGAAERAQGVHCGEAACGGQAPGVECQPERAAGESIRTAKFMKV